MIVILKIVRIVKIDFLSLKFYAQFSCAYSDNFYIQFRLPFSIGEVLGAQLVGIGAPLQGLQSD